MYNAKKGSIIHNQRRKTNDGCHNKIYTSKLKISEPEPEGVTSKEVPVGRAKTPTSAAANKTSNLKGLVSDEFIEMLEGNFHSRRNMGTSMGFNPNWDKSQKIDYTQNLNDTQVTRKLYQQSVELKQVSHLPLKHEIPANKGQEA